MPEKRIKIACVVPKSDDPTSYYRAFGPLGELRDLIDFDLHLPNVYNWATMASSDILFVQRPADPRLLNVVNQAKLSRVPVWIDYDDCNLSVPSSNESIEVFGDPVVKDMLTKVSRLADVITVSTEHLKKRYSIYNKAIEVIPNALNERYMHLRDIIPKRPRDKTIVWRGGPGFLENIQEITQPLISIAKKNPSWKFVFMGHNPWPVTNHIKGAVFIPWNPDYIQYLAQICQIHPTAWVHSLAPNDHSLSRSNIVWQEATLAGGVCLAPNFPEFNRPGIINFHSSQDFEDKLQAVIDGRIDVEAQYRTSWNYILDNYTLGKHNEKRLNVIKRLLELRKGFKAEEGKWLTKFQEVAA